MFSFYTITFLIDIIDYLSHAVTMLLTAVAAAFKFSRSMCACDTLCLCFMPCFDFMYIPSIQFL